jgi:hypothetical protein
VLRGVRCRHSSSGLLGQWGLRHSGILGPFGVLVPAFSSDGAALSACSGAVGYRVRVRVHAVFPHQVLGFTYRVMACLGAAQVGVMVGLVRFSS